METETMGRVLTEATIENIYDLHEAARGQLPPDRVRRVVVPDALVDTGATILSLPLRLIQQLGLEKKYRKGVRSSAGVSETDVYGTVRLTIQGRDCPTDVLEVADDGPVLVGQIPLEYLDFVVDFRNRRLIGNPEHGGEHMFEQY
jgi:predicted aspartyl protease